MVFFVLSGYLIGGHVLSAFTDRRWSWRSYAISRLTRLWIVLIPALILTVFWDYIGRQVLHGDLYVNNFQQNAFDILSGLTFHHDLKTFLGNAFFLQDILVVDLGTNRPLWSLANEFWYYAIFPLAIYSIHRNNPIMFRLVSGISAIVLCLILPTKLLEYAMVWLLGVAVASSRGFILCYTGYNQRAALAIVSSLALISSLYFTHNSGFASDFLVGFLSALALAFVADLNMPGAALSRVSAFFADFSYTLYLTHLPFLACVLCIVAGNHTFNPSFHNLFLYVLILSMTVSYAIAVYWIFERHTKVLQRKLGELSPQAKAEWLVRTLLSVVVPQQIPILYNRYTRTAQHPDRQAILVGHRVEAVDPTGGANIVGETAEAVAVAAERDDDRA